MRAYANTAALAGIGEENEQRRRTSDDVFGTIVKRWRKNGKGML